LGTLADTAIDAPYSTVTVIAAADPALLLVDSFITVPFSVVDSNDSLKFIQFLLKKVSFYYIIKFCIVKRNYNKKDPFYRRG
jgi:hypothetical protein